MSDYLILMWFFYYIYSASFYLLSVLNGARLSKETFFALIQHGK